MADKIVQIDGVGNVAFPDTMSDSDIGGVIQKQYHPKAAEAPAPAKPSLVADLWNSAKSLFAPKAATAADAQFAQEQTAETAKRVAQHPTLAHVADVTGKAVETPLTAYLPQGVRNRVQEVAGRADEIPGHPNLTKVLRGVDASGGRIAEGLTTPTNLATLGVMSAPGIAESALGEAATGAFKAQAGVGAAQGGYQTYKAVKQGDVQGAAEGATDTLANLLMYGAAAKHSSPKEAAPRLTPEEAITAPEPVAPAEPAAPVQQDLTNIQGHLFPQEPEHTAPTAPEAPPIQPDKTDQGLLTPVQGKLFTSKGEALPPQEVEVNPVAPKVPEAIAENPTPEPTPPQADAVAPVETPKAVAAEPSAPVADTFKQPETVQEEPAKTAGTSEGVAAQAPAAGSDPASQSAHVARGLVGKILNLTRLVKGDTIHSALDKGIRETEQLLHPEINDPEHPNFDPAGPNIGNGLEPHEQALLTHLFGEKVGSVLTEDQLQKAYEYKGKVMGTEPRLARRPFASKENVNADRIEMAKRAKETNDPEERDKLIKALSETDSKGNAAPYLYRPVRENVPNKPIDADHVEAPFRTVQFGATAPSISMSNLRDALPGEPIRNLHLGMGDRDIAAQLKQAAPEPTSAGEQEVMNSLDSFGLDRKANDANITGDAADLQAEYARSGARNKLMQMSSKLRDTLAAYKNTTNGADPLVDQLKALPPETLALLPKEVHELVNPTPAKASESLDSRAAAKGSSTPEETAKTSAAKTTEVAASPKNIKAALANFGAAFPAKLDKANRLFKVAADHFGDDLKGAMRASLDGIKLYQKGLEAGDEFAYRKAALEIKSRTPVEPGEGTTLNSGLNPAPVLKGMKQIRNRVNAQLDPHDLTLSTQDAMEARLSRYEQMSPSNRSAYSRAIWDDENDRMAHEGDVDNTTNFKQRLAAIRKDVPRNTINATFKYWLTGKGTPEQLAGAEAGAATENIIRGAGATAVNNIAGMRAKLEDANRVVSRWSNFEKRDFTNKMENGVDQGDAFKNQVAGMLREALDQARNHITATTGDFEHYLENYFPHIYNNVGKVAELSRSTRGMTGDTSFLKTREIDLINDAYAKGYSQKTDNPIMSSLMRIEQMERYAMSEVIKSKMKESGIAKLYKENEPVPAGIEPLDDAAFPAGAAGRYYAPSEAAKIFSSFTSKGLRGSRLAGLPIYDSFRAVSNIQNGLQLSWSALHGFFGGVNSYLSAQAHGSALLANAVLRGEFDSPDIAKGAKALLNAPRIIRTISMGTDLIAHIKDPNRFQDYASLKHDSLRNAMDGTGVTLQDLGMAFNKGGMRLKNEPFGLSYADKFHDAMAKARDDAFSGPQRGKAAMGAIVNGAMRIVDYPTSLIMDHFIPALKAGHFAQEAGDLLSDQKPKTFDEVITGLGKIADTMDDRFGQMVYDNLFISQTAKDVMGITMRSPGWNIGTARAGYGGIADAVAAMRDVATKKQKFQISNRTAYLGAMVANTMLINGLVNYAMTGDMPHGADYFFARTGTKDANGQENRIMPKMYLYDMISAVKHPITTALHKSAPLVSSLSDLYTNKSFYGREIYDPGASLGSRLAQMASYAASESLPFSATNFKEARSRGEGGAMSVLGSVTGVNPAPKWVGRTDAENMASEYYAAAQRSGGIAGDEFDRRAEYQATIAQVRNGSMSKEQLKAKIKSGEVSSKILDHIYDHSKPMVVRWTNPRDISPTQAMHVFEAGTPEERKLLSPNMLKQADKITDPVEHREYVRKIQEGLGRTPSSHVFSPSAFQEANPGADIDEATEEAKRQGYTIHAH